VFSCGEPNPYYDSDEIANLQKALGEPPISEPPISEPPISELTIVNLIPGITLLQKKGRNSSSLGGRGCFYILSVAEWQEIKAAKSKY
jgi:hypothetical protein